MRWWRLSIWLGSAVVMGSVLLVALLTGKLGDASILTSVLGLGVSVTGLAVSLWRDISVAGEATRSASPRDRLGPLTERLAQAVKEQWRAEWRLRRLQDPHPFQVQWSAAEAWLSDVPESVGPSLGPDGQMEGISSALDAVPSRRLVVLGEPGSGKTVLAIRFVLERLEHRAAGDPVPVVFPLSGWQPDREGLRDWMTSHLRATYPGAPWSKELLTAGLVLPVLDGLDELPAESWGLALRRLNAELDPEDPLLLTCRTAAYTKAVETGDVLTTAAVVELRPLTFEAASTYLARTARPVRGAAGQRVTLWDPVFTHLRAHPTTPVSQAIREALATPLLVAMARAVYGDTGRDPAELLQDRFADPAVLERHLLEAYVPAAFADSPYAQRASRWLSYLAGHLERQTTRQLAWWQLRLELPWPLQRLGPILLLGCASVVISLGWKPATAVITGAFLVGVCLGYLAFSRGRLHSAGAEHRHWRQLARDVLIIAVAAVPAGLLVGCTTSPSLSWYAFLAPLESTAGWLGQAALAAALGLATVTALAVVGIVGEPHPLYAPFGRYRLLTTCVIVLLAAAVAYRLSYTQSSTPSAYLTRGLVAAATGALVALGLRGSSRATGAPSARPSGHVAPWRFMRPLMRGLMVGLMAGVVLGAAFGTADAAALSVRAVLRPDLPHGTQHRLADGTPYVITPDGWLHGLRPNGDRYVRLPKPIYGWVNELAHGHREAFLAASLKDASCQGYTGCTTFHGHVELQMRMRLLRFFNPLRSQEPPDYLEIRLPNGTYADFPDPESPLPERDTEWLTVLPPIALFGRALGMSLTIGLALGLISGLAAGLHSWLVFPADTARAVNPLTGLHTDRATVITRGVTLLASALLAGLLSSQLRSAPGLQATWVYLWLGHAAWLPVSPFAVFLSAWGWFLITRLWLCGSGRLPWRLMTFLEEAHQRGVLRQTGAAYEFRHARLQEQLAITASQND